MHRLHSNKHIHSLLLTFVVMGLILATASAFATEMAGTTSHNTRLFIHKTSSGGKGHDVVNLSACYQQKSAMLHYKKKLFGYANIVRITCNKKQCSAIVDWKHKPAGRVDYYISYRSVSNCT